MHSPSCTIFEAAQRYAAVCDMRQIAVHGTPNHFGEIVRSPEAISFARTVGLKRAASC